MMMTKVVMSVVAADTGQSYAVDAGHQDGRVSRQLRRRASEFH